MHPWKSCSPSWFWMKRNMETPPTDDQNQSVDHNVTQPPVVEPEPEFNPYAWIPIIQTEYPEILEDGSIRLSGRVLYDGGEIFRNLVSSPHLRINRYAPDTPESKRMEPWIGSVWSSRKSYPNRLYLQAYAVNEAGMGVGQRRRLKIPEAPAKWWGQATKSEGDWMESNWFGAFKYYELALSRRTGMVILSPAEDGVWLWELKSMDLDQGVYPYHYLWEDAGWGSGRSPAGIIRTYNYVTERYEN